MKRWTFLTLLLLGHLAAFGMGLPWGLPILFVMHLLLAAATFIPNLDWLGEVVSRFDASGRKEVWLTIDDGPHAKETPVILDLLDEFKAKATFFVIGERLGNVPDLGREIVARGHEIGNHTHSHPAYSFWSYLRAATDREIEACSQAINESTGKQSQYFRAPAGLRNAFLHPVLAKKGLRLIGWSARGFDAVKTDTDVVVERVLKEIRPGSIILLHECNGISATCLRGVLEGLQRQGFRCVIPEPDSLG